MRIEVTRREMRAYGHIYRKTKASPVIKRATFICAYHAAVTGDLLWMHLHLPYSMDLDGLVTPEAKFRGGAINKWDRCS
jgi:hypothetical protein